MEKDMILIVGGGPAGLIMAIELLRRKVPVRILEKRKGPSHTARAMTVHARSMEMFHHMGVASRLEEVCLECPGNIYHFPGVPDDECPRTDYRVLPTSFPFYYKISQNDFEQVLREFLYAQYSMLPEYRTELVKLVQDGDRVVATIRLPDGQEEECSYPYVVGCDGVRSFVRDAAGIKFNGEVIAAMAMMDVPLENVTFDDRWMNYYFNKDLFMNCTKMPGDVWRIYMSEETGEFVYAKDIRQAFQEVADRIGIGFKVGVPEWATSWEIRNNIAERYRTGRMLICGDASHVHSPSGGQGMNGCMQDAFNLGWKLAAVFKGEADDSILDTYERERKPIGEQISNGAMATHHIVMGFGIEPAERLPLTKAPGWEQNTIKLVSGLSHNYCDVVQLPSGLKAVAGPRAGARAPDCLLTKSPQRRLYDIYRRPQFTLLIVPGADDDENHIKIGIKARDALETKFPRLVSSHMISSNRDSGFDFDHRARDEQGAVAKLYEIGPEGRLVLVRPDLYVGVSCVPEDWAAIPKYLEQWYNVAQR